MRAFAKSTNVKRSALSHIGGVHIKFEDLLLREPLFQLNRNEHLGQLTFEGPLTTDKKAWLPGKLHGERSAALAPAIGMNDVIHHCGSKPVKVDAIVLKETPVFDRDDCVDQHLGHVFVGDQPALGAILTVEKARDQLRL